MTKVVFLKVLKDEDGKRQLRINRPDQLPEDIEISHYTALTLAADLLNSIPYKAVKK